MMKKKKYATLHTLHFDLGLGKKKHSQSISLGLRRHKLCMQSFQHSYSKAIYKTVFVFILEVILNVVIFI